MPQNISVTGVEQAIMALREKTGKTETELKLAVKKAAFTIEADAKENCKYVTGTARRSITTKGPSKQSHQFRNDYTKKMENGTLSSPVTDWMWAVGSNLNYFPDLERRTHVLTNAAKKAEKEFPDLVESTVKKVT
jgi:hypothetical protein